MRILIAEDDSTSRLMLSTVLKKVGYEVIETSNGEDAWLELRKPDSPSLAILDWMMPKIDGLEVIRLVRALHHKKPPYLIMLTAKSEKRDIVSGLEAGANDYLGKPFDIGELRARVAVGKRMVEIEAALAAKMDELQNAFEQIKTLKGILPICANCKKIRDDRGYWNQVEEYVQNHSEAEFSHGLCPDCVEKLYPELAADVNHKG